MAARKRALRPSLLGVGLRLRVLRPLREIRRNRILRGLSERFNRFGEKFVKSPFRLRLRFLPAGVGCVLPRGAGIRNGFGASRLRRALRLLRGEVFVKRVFGLSRRDGAFACLHLEIGWLKYGFKCLRKLRLRFALALCVFILPGLLGIRLFLRMILLYALVGGYGAFRALLCAEILRGWHRPLLQLVNIPHQRCGISIRIRQARVVERANRLVERLAVEFYFGRFNLAPADKFGEAIRGLAQLVCVLFQHRVKRVHEFLVFAFDDLRVP